MCMCLCGYNCRCVYMTSNSIYTYYIISFETYIYIYIYIYIAWEIYITDLFKSTEHFKKQLYIYSNHLAKTFILIIIYFV